MGQISLRRNWSQQISQLANCSRDEIWQKIVKRGLGSDYKSSQKLSPPQSEYASRAREGISSISS